VINIGIEGMMLTSACTGFLAACYSGSLILGVTAALISGLLMASLHAILSVYFHADQIISGTVVNILAVGITGFFRRRYLIEGEFNFPGVFSNIRIPGLSAIPFVGEVFFNHQPMVYLALLLVPVLHLALFRTKWGLRTRACGEHPSAAATAGLDVTVIRLRAILFSGALAALGGIWFSLETTGSFEDLMTNGKGFIALAAMIFGKWSPWGAFAGALLFGFSDALQIKLQIMGVHLPYQILSMLPYAVTMVVLAGVVGKAVPPASVGKLYVPENR
jgi:simple sugar transport system permease protein